MKTDKKILALVSAALIALGLFSSGCVIVAAGAAGAGTVAYVRGELQATVANSLSDVNKASLKAIDQLKFVKVSEREDALSALIIARTSDDTKIEIKLESVSAALVKVRIRVGVLGDDRISQAILDKIKENL